MSTSTSEEVEAGAEPLNGSPPALLKFPCIGTGASVWVLTEAQVAEWGQAYPGVDVLSECRRALAWIKANRRKTARGMPAFLVRWLNGTVDRGRSAAPRPVRTSGNVEALQRFVARGQAS